MSPPRRAEAAHQEDVQSERSGLQPPLGPAGAAGTHQAWVRWGGDTEGLCTPLSPVSEFQTCPSPHQRLPACRYCCRRTVNSLPTPSCPQLFPSDSGAPLMPSHRVRRCPASLQEVLVCASGLVSLQVVLLSHVISAGWSQAGVSLTWPPGMAA